MKVIENVYYTPEFSPMQSLDIYLPDCESFPVVIYFHYGGITRGDKSGYKFIPYLQKRGIAVISANYRLYPNAAYPDFICDAAKAVAWAYAHMPEYGKVTDFYVAGSSAGGYLTAMLCFDKKYLACHGIDADKVSGYIIDGGQPTTHFNVLVERGMDKRRVVIDEAAPIYHITDERVYPPIQIIVAEWDMRNRKEQNNLLFSTLKHFDHDMQKIDYCTMSGYKHVGYVNAIDDRSESVFANVIFNFVDKTRKMKESY